MKKLKHSNMIYVYGWIILFVILFFGDAWIWKGKLFEFGALYPHPGEYWRYFTASFLHQNLIHLIANCIAIYCVARLADNELTGLMMSVLMIIANLMTYFLFANLWSFTTSIGSSPGIYASIGYLFMVKLKKQTLSDWKCDTGYYLIWFTIIPQLQGFAACFVHGVGFIIGLLFGTVYHGYKNSDSQ